MLDLNLIARFNSEELDVLAYMNMRGAHSIILLILIIILDKFGLVLKPYFACILSVV